jgi:hypothetical protein
MKNKLNKCLVVFFFLLSFVQLSNAQFLWYENESGIAHLEYSAVSNGTFSTNVSNPDKTGINTNSIVSRFDRDESTSADISFNLKSPITTLSNLTISLKAYISLATEDLKNPNTRIRIYLGHSTASGNIYIQKHFSAGQLWQTFEFDFNTPITFSEVAQSMEILLTGLTNSNAGTTPRFRIYDITFHLDLTSLSLKSVKDDIIDLKIFPNPVKNVFSLSKEVESGTLFNILGAKSYEFKNKYKNIDISNLKSGFYFLQVNLKDGNKKTIKLLKD